MYGKERDEHATGCPRCGEEAQWSFLDEEKRRIEVMCQNCGRFEMAREDLDLALTDSAQLTEPEQAV